MKQMHKKVEKYSSELINELLAGRSKTETAKTRNKMILAAKIEDGIKAKGWGKSQFAEKMGKKPSVVTKWLSGTHNFTSDRLTEIGLKLGISLLDLTPKEVVVKYRTIVVQKVESDIQIPSEYGLLIDSYSKQVSAEC